MRVIKIISYPPPTPAPHKENVNTQVNRVLLVHKGEEKGREGTKGGREVAM